MPGAGAGVGRPGHVSREFLTFAAIGAAAFGVDALLLYGLIEVGAGFYLGRLGSWTGAASFTWFFNRRLTFRGAAAEAPLRQWLKFLSANALGGAVNYGVYALAIAGSAVARDFPVLAVAAGSAAGLVLNFRLSRRFVFRRP
jgi:putative flippase GtrA